MTVLPWFATNGASTFLSGRFLIWFLLFFKISFLWRQQSSHLRCLPFIQWTLHVFCPMDTMYSFSLFVFFVLLLVGLLVLLVVLVLVFWFGLLVLVVLLVLVLWLCLPPPASSSSLSSSSLAPFALKPVKFSVWTPSTPISLFFLVLSGTISYEMYLLCSSFKLVPGWAMRDDLFTTCSCSNFEGSKFLSKFILSESRLVFQNSPSFSKKD